MVSAFRRTLLNHPTEGRASSGPLRQHRALVLSSFGGRVLWLLLLVLLPSFIGCDGCRLKRSPDQDAKKIKPAPPFTATAAKAYPAARPDAGYSGFPDGSVKPGHWSSVEVTLKSNRDDRRGVLETQAEVDSSDTSAAGGSSFPIPRSESSKSIRVRRPAILPKGQSRRLETRLLIPDRGSRVVDAVRLDAEFLAGDSAARFDVRPARFSVLSPQTYFFVILTNRPERFARLQRADWINVDGDDASPGIHRDNYRLILPPTQGVLPIAGSMLDWTSTAVLLWDNVPDHALTASQQTAIVDWLHFGGLMIVNGPDAVNSLSQPMFKEQLPIQSAGVAPLDPASARQLIEKFSVTGDLSAMTILDDLKQELSPIATAGAKRADAAELGAGGLIQERRVGRGRIVQSRVDLMSEWLIRWESYDSFFNSALLARPPRVYRPRENNESMSPQFSVSTTPEDTEESADAILMPTALRQTFVGVDGQTVDPAINTGLRLFTRNGKLPTLSKPRLSDEAETSLQASRDNPDRVLAAPLGPWLSNETWPDPASGLGGWKNDSPMLTWSIDALRREIGVTIPDSGRVFRSLLIYLIVLIPINYLVFRSLGRLEWAWLAVVPLAILGALWVARTAQLDIGFARSRSEIAMLELPKDYSRGHLTRTIGLYNSLASQYRIEFDSPDAAIEIIRSKDGPPNLDANLFANAEPELLLGFEAGPVLEPFSVTSNSYGIVHTEQIVDIEGVIGIHNFIGIQSPASENPMSETDWQAAVLVNNSSLDLLDTFAIRRDLAGQTRIAALGTCSSNTRKTMTWQNVDTVSVPPDLPMEMSEAIERLLRPDPIPPGSARLVARLEQPLGGITLSPDCQQVRAQTLVLVHLAYPPRPPAIPDENLIADFGVPAVTASGEESATAP